MLPRVAVVTLIVALTLVACGSAKPTAPASSIPAASATTPQPGGSPLAAPLPPGSFSAFCPAIHVRVLAPPRVMQDESACLGNTLFLTTNITDDSGVEFFTVFRYANDARGQTATGWANILESFRMIDAKSGDTAWSAASAPTPQAAQGMMGFSGPFTRTDKGGVRYAASLWAGAIGDETIVILGQGSVERRAILESDMGQILRTIDLNAQ